MKYVCVWLALGSLLLAASGQQPQEPWCNCAVFVSYEHSEIKVYQAPVINIEHCDYHDTCRDKCIEELDALSNGGDLFSVTSSGETVGTYICEYLAEHLFFDMHNKYVYGYFEVCGGAWEYAGVMAQQKLCCENGEHIHCISD